MKYIATSEISWNRAIAIPAYYISYVRVPPLSFGKTVLLNFFRLNNVESVYDLTHALYIVKQPTFEKAKNAREVWNKRLLLNPKRLWVWIKRVSFQVSFHFLNYTRKKDKPYYIEWKDFVDKNTTFPSTEESEDIEIDDLGLNGYGIIRGVLLQEGIYTPENIMDASMLQVLHDYAWVKGIRVERYVDKAMSFLMKEAIKKGREDAKSKE